MTIEEVQRKIDVLRAAVLDLAAAFETETELEIHSIQVHHDPKLRIVVKVQFPV